MKTLKLIKNCDGTYTIETGVGVGKEEVLEFIDYLTTYALAIGCTAGEIWEAVGADYEEADDNPGKPL